MLRSNRTVRGTGGIVPGWWAKRLLVALFVTSAVLASASRCRAADEVDKPLPPEDVALQTADGVTLAATFFPSKLGKNAVPIILLHASKGNRGDFAALARTLQKAGHAVIAPDLRGHGESVRSRPTDLRKDEYLAMAKEDVEAVKKFLVAKNNDGELNIEKLGIVGVEMGAVVAINWAAMDWSWPVLNTGKQGQDVKALVLISPEWTFKGLRIDEAVVQTNVRTEVSVMIITGKANSKAMAEAKRLYNALEKHRPVLSDEEVVEKQTLWLKTPQTSLQGTRLLNEKSMHADQMITQFIDQRLVKRPLAWNERKNPIP